MAKAKKIREDRGVNFVLNLILTIIAIVSLYPIWFVIIASISDPAAIIAGEVFLIPKQITFSAYEALLDYQEVLLGYRNSLLYMVGGTLVALIGTLPAAYALSRRELKGRRVLNFLVVISMYFSGGMIPTYLLNRSIGWINTIWVMLIPVVFNAYYIILARSSFEGMPEELHESAVMEGASEFRYFLSIVLPLSKAMIAVIVLFSALSWWNEYMRFVIYIDNPEIQSLQVFLRQITQSLTASLTDSGVSFEQFLEAQKTQSLLKYSIVVITALPFCILYPFVQKYFNRGVMIGAVKG